MIVVLTILISMVLGYAIGFFAASNKATPLMNHNKKQHSYRNFLTSGHTTKVKDTTEVYYAYHMGYTDGYYQAVEDINDG